MYTKYKIMPMWEIMYQALPVFPYYKWQEAGRGPGNEAAEIECTVVISVAMATAPFILNVQMQHLHWNTEIECT